MHRSKRHLYSINARRRVRGEQFYTDASWPFSLGPSGREPLDPLRRNTVMKAWSVIGLLFAAAIFATIPISAQVTPRGLELSVDAAKAITYGHARRVSRRVERREFRQTRRAVRRGAY